MTGLLDNLQNQYCPPAIPAIPAIPANPASIGVVKIAESQESQGVIAKLHFPDSAGRVRQGLTPSILSETRRDLEGIARDKGLESSLLERVSEDDIESLAKADHEERAEYLLSLDISEAVMDGRVPKAYTHAAQCRGCGSVWLWAAVSVIACPWCFRRAAGKPIPRP